MEVMYALLVNETSPPMTLSNVRIRNEPSGVTSLRPLPAAPTATANPLYGTKNEASQLPSTLLVLGLALSIVTFVAMTL